MTQRPHLSVVIPAYNEEKRLERAIPAIASYLRKRESSFEMIVVDDGSGDGTGKVVEELAKQYPILRLLRHPTNQGKGAAVRTGMLAAAGDYILFTDADQSTPIGEFEELMQKLEGENYDIAIGSRAMHGAAVEASQGWHRMLAGKLFGLVTKCVAVRGISDTQCGFKCFRHDVAQRIFTQVTSNSAIFDIEMLIVAAREGFRVAEVPVRWTHDPDTRIPYNLKRAFQIFVELFRISRVQGVRWPRKIETMPVPKEETRDLLFAQKGASG